MVEHFDFDLGLRPLSSREVFIDARGDAPSVAHAIDDQPRSEYAIATGKDTGGAGHERVRGRLQSGRAATPARHPPAAENPASVAWPMAMMIVSHSSTDSLFS